MILTLMYQSMITLSSLVDGEKVKQFTLKEKSFLFTFYCILSFGQLSRQTNEIFRRKFNIEVNGIRVHSLLASNALEVYFAHYFITSYLLLRGQNVLLSHSIKFVLEFSVKLSDIPSNILSSLFAISFFLASSSFPLSFLVYRARKRRKGDR